MSSDKLDKPGKIVPWAWGELNAQASSAQTLFLSDNKVALLADEYNQAFPSPRDTHEGLERYIRYATYDLGVFLIAKDVDEAMRTIQSITGYLIMNSDYTGQSGKHWISVVYTITPNEKETEQGTSHASALSLITPVRQRNERMNGETSSSSSSSSSSSFFSSSLDFSNNIVTFDYCFLNTVLFLYLTHCISSCVLFVALCSLHLLLYFVFVVVEIFCLIAHLKVLHNFGSRRPYRIL